MSNSVEETASKALLFQDLLRQKDYSKLRHSFKVTEVADIAEAAQGLEPLEIMTLLRLVPRVRRAGVFSYLPREKQEVLLTELPDLSITALLNDMEPDDRTKLLEELTPEITDTILQRLNPSERRVAFQLLSYPEESVGRLMNPEFVTVQLGMRVSDAVEYVRWNAARYSEEILNKVFVIDVRGHYLGEVSLPGLLIADPSSQPVDAVISKAQVFLLATDHQTKAVDFFRKYGRTIIPVLDEQGILLGVVTADDVFELAEEEATEDIQQFGGTATLEDSYFDTPVWLMIRKRAGWLAILFLGGNFTSNAMHHYDGAIQSMRYLVYFLPLIISSGGNSGSQAASLIIRGLAVREMRLADWLKILKRELVMGFSLGLILGLLGFVRAVTWGEGVRVGLIILISLIGVVTLGAVVGSMLPFLLKRLNLDPAVSSSPFIASLVDLFGIVIFFEVALFFAKYFGPVVGV